MNSKVTYLASRSLAVYEASLITDYAEYHRKALVKQALKLTALILSFVTLAVLALAGPLAIQSLFSW